MEDDHTETWLREGLEVKVLNQKLGDGALYKKKGVVTGLIDPFTAKVRIPECNLSIKIDQVEMGEGCEEQDELQTSIPKEGEEALVVNGPLMNAHVRVLTIFKDRDYCEAEILTGEHA